MDKSKTERAKKPAEKVYIIYTGINFFFLSIYVHFLNPNLVWIVIVLVFWLFYVGDQPSFISSHMNRLPRMSGLGLVW